VSSPTHLFIQSFVYISMDIYLILLITIQNYFVVQIV
jgi:hypothetical protein